MLRAVQQVDKIPDDGLIDSDLAAKKFGASKTVTDQIKRYARLSKTDKSVSAEEIAGLLTLISRRSDSDLVMKIAGQDAARAEVDRTFRILKLGTAIPGSLGLKVSMKVASRASRNLIGIDLTFPGGQPHVVSPNGAFGDVQPIKCLFDAAAVAEILHVVTDFHGALAHTECRARGADSCVWSVISSEKD